MSLGCYFGNQGFFNSTGYNKAKTLFKAKIRRVRVLKLIYTLTLLIFALFYYLIS